MREFANLAELAAEQGNEIGVSSWTEISQERINQFAEVTGDHQWIHTDPERTRRELDMSTIAPWLSDAIASAGVHGRNFRDQITEAHDQLRRQ